MKTVMSENEVNRVPADAISLSLQKLPYNGQDDLDKTLAEHFLLKNIASKINGRLKKLDDYVKDKFPEDKDAYVTLSENWRREAKKGEPREVFDLDLFLDEIIKAHPDLLKHSLKELSLQCKKRQAAPVTITVEYIGDTARR